MNTIRAFVAIELPQQILEQLAEVQSYFKASLPKGCVRWVRPEGIHLTLKFLGEVPHSQVDLIKSALGQAAFTVPAFTFAVGQAGCFPSLRRPRVVWIGVQQSGETLKRLHRAVESAIAPLGYPTEARPFNPHLTLGRVAHQVSPGDLRRLGDGVISANVGQLGQVKADEVALIQSHLKPTGAEYTALVRAPLQG
jgi:2'-5' RNA ligase